MKSAAKASFVSLGIVLAASLVIAQQNTVVPQPRASALPAPGAASPKPSRSVPRPETAMPKVPAGFTVTSYADIRAPRMMVYAPNGDLFVSSPGTNTITVLRDKTPVKVRLQAVDCPEKAQPFGEKAKQ
jgi:endonuclease YncB( thermonuclease family)